MYLNIFLVVLVSLGIILLNDKIKKKGVMYFLIILLIFLSVKKFISERKEYFNTQDEIQNALQKSIDEENKENLQNEQINELRTTVNDLKDVIKKQIVKNTMIRNSESKDFSLEESQKQQDTDLNSLEKELDILLKLYNNENKVNDKEKYKTLPVFSSCKVNDLGSVYRNNERNEMTQQIVEKLEKEELGKNLGIESKTGKDLLSSINKQVNGDMGNVNINLNLE
tara:strand:- start:996 stop:1670 length:675 start_codon:yes stop_codon:yes gene_type:complete